MSERIAVLTADKLLFESTSIPRSNPFARAVGVARAARKMGFSQIWLHPSSQPEALDWSEGDGWDYGRDKPGDWWIHSLSHTDGYGAVDLVRPSLDPHGIWRNVPDGATLMEALTLARRSLGVVWHRAPSTTGTRLLKTLHSGPLALRLDLPATPPEPALRKGTEHAMVWMRPLTAEESTRRYLHSYDVNAQHLAACSSLALGVGPAEHITGDRMTGAHRRVPGYWRAHIEYQPHPLHPMPYHLPRRGTLTWITTPTLELLTKIGADVSITEGYYWPQHHRVMEPWYKRIRDARGSLMENPDPAAAYALRAVKSLYATTIGLFAYMDPEHTRANDALYRPDYWHMVVALARANGYRRVLKAGEEGVFPFAWGIDCLYITSDDPDPVKACPASWPLDNQPGHFKVKDAAVPLDELRHDLSTVGALQHALNLRRKGIAA